MALRITASCVSKPALGAEVVAAPVAAAGSRVGRQRRSGGAARAVRQGDRAPAGTCRCTVERQRGEVVGDAARNVRSVGDQHRGEAGRAGRRRAGEARSVVKAGFELTLRAADGRLADGDQHFVQRQLQLGKCSAGPRGRRLKAATAQSTVEPTAAAGAEPGVQRRDRVRRSDRALRVGRTIGQAEQLTIALFRVAT